MIHLNRLVDVSYVIFALWFLSKLIYLSFSSPNLSARLPYFHTWCGLSANLECMSEMCGMRLAENAGPKKVAKNRHLGTIAQLYWAISLQLRHISTIGKKNLLSSNMSPNVPTIW